MSNPKFGSLEVFFTFPSSVDDGISLITNIEGRKQFAVGAQATYFPVTLRVSSLDDTEKYIQVETLLDDVVVDRSDYFTDVDDDLEFAVRTFFFDQFISVTINDVWCYSYALSEVQYPETIEASLKRDGATVTVTDIRLVELSDGREAVFVDYESTTDNAIQSVIQQRPVQIFAHVDRMTTFTYDAEKDTVPVVYPISYEEEIVRPPGLSSDGLVYADDVGISIDAETAREVGLITKMYRLSELTTGYEKAASFLQKQARERRKPKTVVMRLDPRIEISDVLDIDMTVTSTGRQIEKQVIVEDISIGMRDGEYSLTIKGREKS